MHYRCISCSEGRKIEVLFRYEKNKQRELQLDVTLIAEAILTGCSFVPFVTENQLKCLLESIQFHRCVEHGDCSLPGLHARRDVSELTHVKLNKVKICEFCLLGGGKGCDIAKSYC